MVAPKSTQTRVVGITTDEMHPYILFSSNGVSMKCVGTHLVCYYPYYSCLCIFWHYHPYLLLQVIFSCFLYLFVFIFLVAIY